jgi:Flp pilus assembly protein TadD
MHRKNVGLPLATLALLLAPGCAGVLKRESWPNLPSPWSTIKNSAAKNSTTRSTETSLVGASVPARSSTETSKTPPRTVSESKKAPKNDESVAMAMLNGLNFERVGNWKHAREVYEEIRQKQPENARAAHRLGVVADAQRRHAEAEQLFLLALDKDPRNAEILADLGYCYYLQGELAKAESALSKATKFDPSNHRNWNNLGLAVGHQGRYEEALDCFRKSGSEADAQYNLAFIYAAQDRVNDAKRSFQLALSRDPTHRRAREALASFEEFERLPEDLRNVDDLAADGVRYVPFVEDTHSDSGDSKGPNAVANTSYTASRAARALYNDSRTMLNRNMASQRSDELAKQ